MIPPRSVLAGVDFSDDSRVALALAARLAVHCGATLHVLHAVEPLLAAAARQQGRDLVAESLEELRAFTAGTWPLAACAPRLHAIVGEAPGVILDIASRESADVVVVGSRGMSGAERLLFGSTTEYVLRRADLPVLVVPPDWTPPQLQTPDLAGVGPVIAGVDLSASSLQAAAAAGWLAGSLSTDLEIVHVVPKRHVLARWQPGADAAAEEEIERARRALAPLVQHLALAGAVRTCVTGGDVAHALAARAATEGGRRPLIVLGRRAGGSRGVAPGVTAYRVLGESKAPVLVYVPTE